MTLAGSLILVLDRAGYHLAHVGRQEVEVAQQPQLDQRLLRAQLGPLRRERRCRAQRERDRGHYAFDRYGGRWPLVVGFLVLAASGAALAIGVADASVASLTPGLVLQGIGLGIVLTVNDPVGLSSVPPADSGQAAGVINTTEQLGGAIGIAGFLALEYRHYLNETSDRLAERGIQPTPAQEEAGREFMLKAEQEGLRNVQAPEFLQRVFDDLNAAHVDGFQLAFGASGAVALLGALVCWALVRRGDPLGVKIRSRRSRWILASRQE
jgi:MFS family permease